MGSVLQIIRAVPASAERPGGLISVDQVESPIVRAGASYWSQLKGSRRFPSRSQISPKDMSGLLRHVVLLSVIDAGDDYLYRIVGDAHVVAHGFNAQGTRLSEMDSFAPGYGRVLKPLYDNPARRGEPLALRGWLSKGEDASEFVYSESVFLPLGPNDETVDQILNFSVYIPQPGTANLQMPA